MHARWLGFARFWISLARLTWLAVNLTFIHHAFPPQQSITILDGYLVLLLLVIAVPNRHITTMETKGGSRRENGGSKLGHTGAMGLGASSLGAHAHADILNRSSFRPTDAGARSDSSFVQGAPMAWGGADEVSHGPPARGTVNVSASHLLEVVWCREGAAGGALASVFIFWRERDGVTCSRE
jgi:hypothetical protein